VTEFAVRHQPWSPDTSRLALRGRVVVRMRTGEAPPAIAYHRDVAIGRAVAATRLDGGGVDRVIRSFSPAMQVTRTFHAARGLRYAGRRHLGWSDLEETTGMSRTFRIQLDPDADLVALVAALRELSHVESAAPEYLNETPFLIAHRDPYASLVDPHALIGAREALAIEPGDSALIVAVVDSGVAPRHPELAGRLRPGVDTVDLPADLVTRNVRLVGRAHGKGHDPSDQMGHGTACSSIIAARGVDMACGLAGAARLLPARALAAAWVVGRPKLTAVGSIENIDAAVKLAVDLGARVQHLSFGAAESALRPHDPRPHTEVVDYALAHDCVLVAASGNSGQTDRYYPAALPGVIAVGALDCSRPALFTNSGPWVDACAPAIDVLSTFVSGSDPERPPLGLLGEFSGWARWSGTSFSAPKVAAAIAREMLRLGLSDEADRAEVRARAVREVLHAPGLFRVPDLGVVVNLP